MEQIRVNNKRDEGFSLIELIVVIAIVAVLVLLSTPRYLKYTDDAKVITMQSNARMLSDAIEQYGIQHLNTLPVKDDVVHWEEDIATETKNLIFQDYRDAMGGDFIYEHEIKKDTELKFIDEDKINSVAKDVENNIKDYVLVTEGLLTGGLYHKEGFRDSSGDYRNGLSTINRLGDNEDENTQNEQEIVKPKHPFFSQYGTLDECLDSKSSFGISSVYNMFSNRSYGALFVFQNTDLDINDNSSFNFTYVAYNDITIEYWDDVLVVKPSGSRTKAVYSAVYPHSVPMLYSAYTETFENNNWKLIDVYAHKNVNINSEITLPDTRSIDELK